LSAALQRIFGHHVAMSYLYNTSVRRFTDGHEERMMANMNAPSLAARDAQIGQLIATGNLPGAAQAAAECRRDWSTDPLGWVLGSVVALLMDLPELALRLIEECLSINGNDLRCLIQRAECLLALGRRNDALQAAADAAASAAGNPAALDAIGEFLVHAGDHAGALGVYDSALASVPDDAVLLAKRATVLRSLGEFDRAATDHRRILTLRADDSEALKGLADLGLDASEELVAAMESALARTAPHSREAAALHFGLAKVREDRHEFTPAWHHLSAANAIERKFFDYDPRVDMAVVDRLVSGFRDVEPAPSDTSGESPIFIVGLPRTGTTLVERIVSSHSAVHAAGELPALSEAISIVAKAGTSASRNWLEFTRLLPALQGPPIAREYLARAGGRRGTKPRFIDKQPTNFFYAPLIFRAFPHAKVVHLTRHPLAACYAIFKTRFQGAFPFAYDLSELGQFYLGYRRVMSHCHKILPGRIMDVAYEEVIADQEAATRRILDYLDLPFEPACLDFHLNPASTATASAIQVRKPIYSSSIDLWRQYASELEPLAKLLRDGGLSFD
jgi:tetratricopeptide (TPR) repeat protein